MSFQAPFGKVDRYNIQNVVNNGQKVFVVKAIRFLIHHFDTTSYIITYINGGKSWFTTSL